MVFCNSLYDSIGYCAFKLVKQRLSFISKISIAGVSCCKQSFNWSLWALPHLCCLCQMLPVCESQWCPMSSRLGNPYCCRRIGPLWGKTKNLRPMLWPLVALGGNHADRKKEASIERCLTAPRKWVEPRTLLFEGVNTCFASWFSDFLHVPVAWQLIKTNKGRR